MAYSITKPNIYFSGDKRILTETIAGSISKFNVVMTHAKDSMYYVIDNSTKDTIEIAIEPFKTDTNCVLTNYIMFPNDFSGKAISFVAPDGYEIYYTGDYTRAKYTENTIIAIQHVDMGKIVISINAGEKTAKYGVLLTLETTEANETVYYTDPADNINLSNVKMYWDYDPVTGKLGTKTHDNSKVYSNAGEHYLVVISDNDLKFPNNHALAIKSYTDISNHLIEIGKYENYSPILVSTNNGYYFYYYKKLKKINTNEIFDASITNFVNCFGRCSSLTSIPEHLFANNTAVTRFDNCFFGCSSLTSIPEHLFDNNTEITTFSSCFSDCSSLTSIPDGLFANNAAVTTFYGCFAYCPSLISIPEHLFDNNTAVTTFDNCFRDCSSLTSIPEHLFDNNTAVTTFSYCFCNCSSLTSIPGSLFANNKSVTEFISCFQGCSSLTSIPGNLFANNKSVTQFTGCFRNCSSLTSIPNGLFDNTAGNEFGHCFQGCSSLTSIPSGLFAKNTFAYYFYSCFRGCSSLTSIPSGLFDNNAAATRFESCFEGCSSLTSIPSGLFDNNTAVYEFSRCFYDCGNITSNVPNLWNSAKWKEVISYAFCFWNCKKATNYSSIPDAWK